MSLVKYLARHGYGSRKEVELLFKQSRVTTLGGIPVRDADVVEHSQLLVDGEPLDPPQGSVILLNKPVGYVCSTKDRPPLVYDLLPSRFLRRSPVMSTIGRLDADTSGLLLLTDDGALNHRLTSPRHHVQKTYRARLVDPLSTDAPAIFASGQLILNGETTPLLPALVEFQGEKIVDITVTEGRYHQVRRMFAAVGNHVVSLQRTKFGPLSLDGVADGTWRVLSFEERFQLSQRSEKAGDEVRV